MAQDIHELEADGMVLALRQDEVPLATEGREGPGLMGDVIKFGRKVAFTADEASEIERIAGALGLSPQGLFDDLLASLAEMDRTGNLKPYLSRLAERL